MVNLAQFGYSDPMQEQNSRDAMLARVRGGSSVFSNQVGTAATEAGENVSEGFSTDFDFGAYGRDQGALKATNDSYTSDQDVEIGVEKQPNMAMGIDLDKLEKLQQMGVPNEVIMQSRGQMNELSVEEMMDQYRESGQLTQEAAAARDTGDDMMKELAADFQKAMAMNDGEMAKDGVSASMAGAHQAAAMGRMMMG